MDQNLKLPLCLDFSSCLLTLVNICLYHELLLKWMCINIKGALSGSRQFLAFKSPLKRMNNAFYFTLKARFVLEIFKFLS